MSANTDNTFVEEAIEATRGLRDDILALKNQGAVLGGAREIDLDYTLKVREHDLFDYCVSYMTHKHSVDFGNEYGKLSREIEQIVRSEG